LPLTPKHILYTQIGNSNNKNIADYSYEYSVLFQKLIIEHAHRYVFARTQIKGMLKLHPRTVDADLFQQEKKVLDSWHGEQMKGEKELDK